MSRAAFLAAPLLLAACAHAPTTPPAVSAQQEWEGRLGTATEVVPAWWRGFRDPVLTSLIAEAEARNVDLRLAAERVLQARAMRRAAAAELFPDTSVQISTSAASGSRTGSDSAAGAFGIAWEPDISGRLAAARRAASSDLRATQADAEAVRQLLFEEVAGTYIDYRLRETLVAVADRTLAAQEGTLRLTRDRFDFGMASDLDVQRMTALVSQTRAQRTVARAAADADRIRLSYLIATTPQDMATRLRDKVAIPTAEPISVLLSPADVLARRPDVAAAADRYAAAAARRDEAAALRLPSLTLSGLVGLGNDDLGGIFDGGADFASIAANLAMPLLDFGRRKAQLESADSVLRQAALAYEATVRQALQETQTGVVAYLQGQVRERDLAQAADAARKAEELSRLQFLAGTISQLEVLDASRTVYEAEQQHASALADVSLRLVSLYRMMGVAPETTATAEAVPR